MLEPGRQRDAADGAGLLVVLPAGADHVAAHHRLDRQRLEALDDDGAAAHLVALVGGDDRFRVDAGELVGHDVAELGEPEVGDGLQYLALARDRVGQDDVEGRQAVGGDDQQLVGVDRVDVADLAPREQWQTGDR